MFSPWRTICFLALAFCALDIQATSAAEPTVAQLIDRLESKNKTPAIKDERTPNFKGFDWKDQDAVIGAGQKLLDNMDEAWPELIDRLDRDGYSITFRNLDSEVAFNLTVGEFAERLLYRAVVAGYRDCSPRDDRVARQMHGVGFVPYGKFKIWCQEQNRLKRSLVDVQLEGCRWARDLVTAADELPADEKKRSLTTLNARIAKLETSRLSIKADYPFDRDGPKPFLQGE